MQVGWIKGDHPNLFQKLEVEFWRCKYMDFRQIFKLYSISLETILGKLGLDWVVALNSNF